MRHVQLLKKTGIQKYGAKNKLNKYQKSSLSSPESQQSWREKQLSFFYKKAMIKLSLGYLINVTLSGYYDIC